MTIQRIIIGNKLPMGEEVGQITHINLHIQHTLADLEIKLGLEVEDMMVGTHQLVPKDPIIGEQENTEWNLSLKRNLENRGMN